MPFRTMLCFFAAVGILTAGDKKDFLNPNPGGVQKAPGNKTAPFDGRVDVTRLLSNLPSNQSAKLPSAKKECSIPLRWGKVDIEPGPGIKSVPHPEQFDGMYAPNPAPSCLSAENEMPGPSKEKLSK
ncbi:MAG: hypothetical protein JOY54_13455 [Acidobacteriaceae bacterium]|nr:hypothetical protein [Acidobacteriaceae bacterium]